MQTILLARHGQASFGSENYDNLSKLGVYQSQLLGDYFGKHNKTVDQIFAGSLVRQQDTASHFINKFVIEKFDNTKTGVDTSLPIQTISQLNEFNHQQILLNATEFSTLAELKASIANEAYPQKKLAELFKQAMIRWHSAEHLKNDKDYDESWLQFSKRCYNGLQKVIEQTADGQTSLVFTSGGVIASIVSQLFNMPTDALKSQTAFSINRQLINTGVTSILVSNARNIGKDGLSTLKKQLITLNACDHLQLAGSEYLTWY
ncbi:MAG: histidine phosphatase family protein [Gammaproteobacteria bacterium]|nr:MAG: histidine phosphatase family protein [Gammaproteobacteria bacterium]